MVLVYCFAADKSCCCLRYKTISLIIPKEHNHTSLLLDKRDHLIYAKVLNSNCPFVPLSFSHLYMRLRGSLRL